MKKSLVLGLGSNLGNRYAYIQQAITLLVQKFKSDVITSNVYQTEPWGNKNQATFLNTVVALDTSLNSLACFKLIKEIEQIVGRKRSERWGPRSIDIDILFLGDEISEINEIIIPHPRIVERSFVIIPASDLMPNFTHPKYNRTLSDLSNDMVNDCKLFAKHLLSKV